MLKYRSYFLSKSECAFLSVLNVEAQIKEEFEYYFMKFFQPYFPVLGKLCAGVLLKMRLQR